MVKYLNYDEKYNDNVYELFSDFQKEENFYKDLTKLEFFGLLFSSRGFQKEGTFLAVDGDDLVGIVSANVRDSDLGNEKACGYVHTLIVKKERRREGIGSKLLELAHNFIKEKGLGGSRVVFLGGVNYPWYIPHTDKHMHPGCPGVRINSEFYIFLYHHGYFVNSIHEGFHVNLKTYEFPQKVVDIIKKNEEEGITVELYDKDKHYGVDEFCNIINNPGFAYSIQYNLKREKPYPFVVASDHGKMVGWTGSIYREASGRGHLDGICVSPEVRGKGLGTAVFATLCKELKKLDSDYMTLFTGLDNPARYIYLGAGFNVACSFADMKKNFNNKHN